MRGIRSLSTIPSHIKSPFAPSSSPILQHESLPPQILVQCVPNNIFITVTSQPGHILFKLSSGLIGLKNAAKTSPKAAMALVDALSEKFKAHNIRTIRLNFRGINSARPLIVSQLRKADLRITEVIDTTGIPFNGCRPKKTRRV